MLFNTEFIYKKKLHTIISNKGINMLLLLEIYNINNLLFRLTSFIYYARNFKVAERIMELYRT